VSYGPKSGIPLTEGLFQGPCWHHHRFFRTSQGLRAILNKGPRSSDQWIQAILFVESFKLVPRPLDEGPRPKSGKLRKTYMEPVLEGKSIGSDQETLLKKESPWFGEPRIRLGTKVQFSSRIQFGSNQSTLVPRKLDPRPSSKVCIYFYNIAGFVVLGWSSFPFIPPVLHPVIHSFHHPWGR
jgi:hypothetical protein